MKVQQVFELQTRTVARNVPQFMMVNSRLIRLVIILLSTLNFSACVMISSQPYPKNWEKQTVSEQGSSDNDCVDISGSFNLYGALSDGALSPVNLYEILFRKNQTLKRLSDQSSMNAWLAIEQTTSDIKVRVMENSLLLDQITLKPNVEPGYVCANNQVYFKSSGWEAGGGVIGYATGSYTVLKSVDGRLIVNVKNTGGAIGPLFIPIGGSQTTWIRFDLYSDNNSEYKDKVKYGLLGIKKLYRLSHILVPSEAEARSLENRLKHGGDFASLAKNKSTDTDSAKKEGDLGWTSAEIYPKSIAEAITKMSKGEISAPIHTEYGWHIIKLADVKDDDNHQYFSSCSYQLTHITLASKDKAQEVIDQLDKGEDFEHLVKEKSSSSVQRLFGGEMYHVDLYLFPAFTPVLPTLKEGEFTRAPIQDKAGWHVIRVNHISPPGCIPLMNPLARLVPPKS